MVRVTAAYLHAKARKCRWLAKGLDSATAKTLTDMADEFEAKAGELERHVTQNNVMQ